MHLSLVDTLSVGVDRMQRDLKTSGRVEECVHDHIQGTRSNPLVRDNGEARIVPRADDYEFGLMASLPRKRCFGAIGRKRNRRESRRLPRFLIRRERQEWAVAAPTIMGPKLAPSEPINYGQLHSARVGECGSVIAKGAGYIMLILHRESVEADRVRHIKDAPPRLNALTL